MDGNSDDVRVNLTLTNSGDKPVRLLKWQLPGSEDAPCSWWSGTASRSATRGPDRAGSPDRQGLPAAAAGQSLTVQAEVSGLYDMSAQGQYSIRYPAADVAARGESRQGQAGPGERIQCGDPVGGRSE